MGKRVSEKQLVQEAQQFVAPPASVQHGLRPGQKVPADFKNPPIGTPEHFCVDPEGRYQPTWFQLYLLRPHGMKSQKEFFNENGKKWFVAFNTWVDVPPEIINVLREAQVTVYASPLDQAGEYAGNLQRPGTGVRVSHTEPAYHSSIFPSAR